MKHTIYEVAAAAGVSIATVSRVLSKPDLVAAQTRQRVMTAVSDLNYLPTGAARSLAARSNEAFGLALPELRGPYYAELLSGFEEAAAELGASVMLALTHGKLHGERSVRRLAGKVDALAILDGVDLPDGTLELLGRKLPLVVIAGGAGRDHVSTANTDSARQLTNHLITAHGRSNLLFIGDPTMASDIQERHRGFAEAHLGHGLPLAEPVPCQTTESEGIRVAHLILEGRLRADALVCANDELAVALQHTLIEGGMAIPNEISITGWDDILSARYVTPALSTVSQPLRDLAHLSVRHIQQLLTGCRDESLPSQLPTTVVLRHSCGCA